MKSNKFISWLKDLFKDERGLASVKPVIAVIGSLFLCITMVISAFSKHQIDPSAALVDAVTIITAIGMGADTLDKFSLRNKKTKPEEPTPQE